MVQLFKHGQTPHTPTLIVLNGELLGENFIYQNQRVWEDPKVRTVRAGRHQRLQPGERRRTTRRPTCEA